VSVSQMGVDRGVGLSLWQEAPEHNTDASVTSLCIMGIIGGVRRLQEALLGHLGIHIELY
jgi:hypothetical protein